MKSKKDQGNTFFKQQKYAQAIQCYNQYVKKDNADNSKAYSNMALGCYKLKRWQQCINACQNAIQLEPQFQKPYFRMYQVYKQTKNYYGIIIIGTKFCKISKQQKQIKIVQKSISQAKQKLSYQEQKIKQTQNDKLILQIINKGQDQKQTNTIIKQPQCSLDTKWNRILQKIKKNKYQGYNQGRKFILKQCQTQEQKQKFQKLLTKVKYQGIKQNQDNNSTEQQQNKNNQKDNQSDQEEELSVQQLAKYNNQKEKQKKKLAQQQKLKTQLPKQNIQSQITQKSFKKIKQSKEQQKAIQQNHVKQSQKSKLNYNTVISEPKPQTLQQNTTITAQKVKSQNNQSHPNLEVQKDQNWQSYVNIQQANRLFSTYIQNKLASADDPFAGFFKYASQVLRSADLDRYQKMAILSIAPTKVKKFNLILKSYTGRQKQQLAQLFGQNNLHHVLDKYYLKK